MDVIAKAAALSLRLTNKPESIDIGEVVAMINALLHVVECGLNRAGSAKDIELIIADMKAKTEGKLRLSYSGDALTRKLERLSNAASAAEILEMRDDAEESLRQLFREPSQFKEMSLSIRNPTYFKTGASK
jgi:DNA-binding IscR family transcriptional regulator